jgi:hypothetical protein
MGDASTDPARGAILRAGTQDRCEDFMTRDLLVSLTGLMLIAAAGAANAEPIGLRPYPAAKAPAMSLARDAAIQISRPGLSLPVRYANAPAQLPRGIAKTSVESRIAGDGPVASAGVLCGLKPSADYSGAGTARGYDNDGRFVGAKLAFSF